MPKQKVLLHLDVKMSFVDPSHCHAKYPPLNPGNPPSTSVMNFLCLLHSPTPQNHLLAIVLHSIYMSLPNALANFLSLPRVWRRSFSIGCLASDFFLMKLVLQLLDIGFHLVCVPTSALILNADILAVISTL